MSSLRVIITLQWRHNGRDSVSNHQPYDCFLNRLFRRRWKKISKLRVTGLCAGNSPEPGEFPAQMASNAENVYIWWRHHDIYFHCWAVATALFCHLCTDRPILTLPHPDFLTWHLHLVRLLTNKSNISYLKHCCCWLKRCDSVTTRC